jgi:acid phosphatase
MPVLAQTLPIPDHIVIVIEENKSFTQIIGNPAAPYINELSKRGTLFTDSYGVTHPSQPNYLALFSGSTHSIVDDACPLALSGMNLASELIKKGRSFISYAETMPQAGFEGCNFGAYARKHNPVTNWKELISLSQPFNLFPQDFSRLPTVTFIIPDLLNDMHDGTIARGDAWLFKNIESYAQWTMTHNSLLIITWDEDYGSKINRIPTLFVGPMVKPGSSIQRINHYNILRTIEEMMELDYLGESAQAEPIADIWLVDQKKLH